MKRFVGIHSHREGITIYPFALDETGAHFDPTNDTQMQAVAKAVGCGWTTTETGEYFEVESVPEVFPVINIGGYNEAMREALPRCFPLVVNEHVTIHHYRDYYFQENRSHAFVHASFHQCIVNNPPMEAHLVIAYDPGHFDAMDAAHIYQVTRALQLNCQDASKYIYRVTQLVFITHQAFEQNNTNLPPLAVWGVLNPFSDKNGHLRMSESIIRMPELEAMAVNQLPPASNLLETTDEPA